MNTNFSDKLFMTWNCSDCVKIKEVLDMDCAISDDRKGKEGQILTFVQMFSNVGTQDIISYFFPQLPAYKATPLLKTCNDEYIADVDKIIEYLKEQGYTRSVEKA